MNPNVFPRRERQREESRAVLCFLPPVKRNRFDKQRKEASYAVKDLPPKHRLVALVARRPPRGCALCVTGPLCHRAVVSQGLCVIGPLCHRVWVRVRVRRSTNKVYKLS